MKIFALICSLSCASVVSVCTDSTDPLSFSTADTNFFCSNFEGKNCAFYGGDQNSPTDNGDCIWWTVDDSTGLWSYTNDFEVTKQFQTVTNGCLNDEQRQELFNSCPSACNFCSADRVAAIQDKASYVDPIARDICSDWANFDCLKWDAFPAVGFLGGLSSFQRWGLLISCPLSCYQENRVETYYLRQVPTCALVEEDSIETFDGDGEKCAGVCKAKKFNDNILFKDKLGYSCVDYWMNDGSPGTFDCFDKDYFADNLFSDLEVAQFWDSCPNACRVFC